MQSCLDLQTSVLLGDRKKVTSVADKSTIPTALLLPEIRVTFTARHQRICS